ncbi:MAG: helix-turn-helix domain-containing protein [Acidaminococcaceae bacterium]|nr:helix-turn-helix domain-containing protein [Acidaminococcaceae bacterium]
MSQIGDYLKEGRAKKSLTIEEVAEGTGIRTQYLEALERGEYSKIPGDVFIKGFLRNYGNYLGLDGNEIVEEYKRCSTRDKLAAVANNEATTVVSNEPIIPATVPEQKKVTPIKSTVSAETTPKTETVKPKLAKTEDKPKPAVKSQLAAATEPLQATAHQKGDYDSSDVTAQVDDSNEGTSKKGFVGKIKNFINDNFYETYEDDEDDAVVFEEKPREREHMSTMIKEGQSSFFNYKVFFVCLIVFLAIAAAGFMMFMGGKKESPQAIKNNGEFTESVKSPHSTEKTEKKTSQNTNKEESTKATKAEPIGSGDLVIEITYKKPVWTQVTADGNGVEAATIPAGTTKTYKANNKITVSLGSLRDVEIKRNGKVVPYGEKEWGTVEKVFTK